MRCPVCRSPDTRVLDKRDSADASTTRRRRQCGKCLHRFTTYERPDASTLMVVKSDQRRQEWNPDKLRRSLQVACTKRPISAETIERTVEQIEAELRSRDSSEVPSSVVGDLAMEKLRQLDQVAYMRFASVYLAFADICSFEEEVRCVIERAGVRATAQPLSEPSLRGGLPGGGEGRVKWPVEGDVGGGGRRASEVRAWSDRTAR